MNTISAPNYGEMREFTNNSINTLGLKCLRDKKTKKIFALAYTEEGLQMKANNTGRTFYHVNAKFRTIKDKDGMKYFLVGDLRKNPNLEVTDFNPQHHKYSSDRKFERFWINTALNMIY